MMPSQANLFTFSAATLCRGVRHPFPHFVSVDVSFHII
jgi:hypothetical protein